MAKTVTKGSGKKKSRKKNGSGNGEHPEAASVEARSNNRKDRGTIIRETCRKLAEIEAEREALNARSKELTNLNIKGQLGMSKKNFMLAYGQYLLEPDERAQLFEDIREIHTALKTGEQTNFLDVMAAQDRKLAEELAETRTQLQKEARTAGREAGYAGKSAADNPHDKGSKAFVEWDEGHRSGMWDRIQEIGPAAGPGSLSDVAKAVEDAQAKSGGTKH